MDAPKAQQAEIVDQAVFEGLFKRAFPLTDPLAEELRAIGYDAKKPRARYPARVLIDAIELARRRFFPELPVEEGTRAVGRRFIQGYTETILGRLVVTMLPFLPKGDRGKTVSRMFGMARKDIKLTATQRAPNQWSYVFSDAVVAPDFTAGIFEAASLLMKRKVRIEVVSRSGDSYEILTTDLK